MNDMERYIQRVRQLLASLEGTLSRSEVAEVEHYVDHGESSEGIRLLAWIIVEKDKKISSETLASIRELSKGLVAPEHMPPGLDEQVRLTDGSVR